MSEMKKKFLIQTFDDEIRHDFAFELRNAIEYQRVFGNNNLEYEKMSYEQIIDSDGIPVGSVELVCDCLKKQHNKTPKPKNVPNLLKNHTNRHITNGTEKDIIEGKKQFVKSNDRIKGFSDIVSGNSNVPEGNYQISDVIEIWSEYRVFVFRNEIEGIHHYSGNPFVFPCPHTIQEMVKTYEIVSPIAYTLDVGVNKNGTFVIEVHDFFSCGLYGFSNYNILPQMCSSWFYEFIR